MSKSLDVLMVTHNDWANIGYEFAKCLRLLNLEVRFIKGRKHASYPIQGEISAMEAPPGYPYPELSFMVTANQLRPLMEEAHVVHFTSSTFVLTGTDLRKKHVVVQHDGNAYYMKHEILNELFDQFTDVTILQAANMLGLGAKNAVWICNPVDTELLQPDFGAADCVRIGHFPSNPAEKGTTTILSAIETLESDRAWSNKFQYVGAHIDSKCVDWSTNLDRMRNCDIVVVACGPGYNREWGTTTLEAAALGAVPVVNSQSRDLYEREYGKWALHIANDFDQLLDVLKHLISLSARDLQEEKRRAREWVVRYHSFGAVARRLWDKVYNKRFYKLEGDELIRC